MRVLRGALWALTALYCLVVASIVFAPVHVDDNEMGGRLAALLDAGHAAGWLPEFVTYSSIEQLSHVIMFVPGGFLFAPLLGPSARRHVLYAGFVVSLRFLGAPGAPQAQGTPGVGTGPQPDRWTLTVDACGPRYVWPAEQNPTHHRVKQT